jgi:hypothetical protein
MPIQLIWAIFFASALAIVGAIWVTAADLPAMVAARFDASGAASGLMSRESYRNTILSLFGFTAISIAAVFAFIPKLPSSSINLPNRDYWLDASRRTDTMNSLTVWGLVLGVWTMLLIAAIHYVLVHAHRQIPPQLDNTYMWIPVAIYMLIVTAMSVWLILRFKRKT